MVPQRCWDPGEKVLLTFQGNYYYSPHPLPPPPPPPALPQLGSWVSGSLMPVVLL